MAEVPANLKIYHITHVRNLPQIVEAGVLWSDAKRNDMGLECDVVGMAHVKRRRLLEIEVTCHAGTHVGGTTYHSTSVHDRSCSTLFCIWAITRR